MLLNDEKESQPGELERMAQEGLIRSTAQF